MTITHIKDKFISTLKTIYPISEVTSIFRLLVKHKLGLDAAEIVLEADKLLSKSDVEYFQSCLIRLQNKEPIQYVIGSTDFYNLTFKVTPDVLIPRPETEEIVEWVINDIKKDTDNEKIQILDIGTGSGCIAISLAKNIKNAQISALDLSQNALKIAEDNAQQNNVDILFIHADILNCKTLQRKYDIIISNPPYVREIEKLKMHENVLDFEPKEALFVLDENPLVFYNKIGDLAKKNLSKKGTLYFEINQYLGKETADLLKLKGFSIIEIRKDFLGEDRMIIAQV